MMHAVLKQDSACVILIKPFEETYMNTGDDQHGFKHLRTALDPTCYCEKMIEEEGMKDEEKVISCTSRNRCATVWVC